MVLTNVDWAIISLFFVLVLGISWAASRTAKKSASEFFLAGKSMPWWLLGVSMVATTFSADTPNLVTGFVREGGIVKNWAWWSFLITGMVTVFIYAKLWRRSGLFTDLEFYELRYGGRGASFLRGFRAVYLGLFFNCLIMGSVTIAAIKISSILFGMQPLHTVVIASVVVAFYSALGGIKGVIWTDFFQFFIAMIGAVYVAYVAVNQPEIGGLQNLVIHASVATKLDLIPDFSDPSLLLTMFIIPIAVQWWSVWYPGSEPGGGGYIAQRMLAAKNEQHALGATLFFNFAHYALRPWPWIIVGLASLVLFPDLSSIKAAFPAIQDQYLGEDIAYPVMLTLLSPGWLGLVLASLIAAYMSTISTHLNWGSSYLVYDCYKRFIKSDASEKEQVWLGRIVTVVLMIISGSLALTVLENASQAFNILLLSGAGTGAIFLLRWFWWRINAWTEIVGMVIATINAFVLTLWIPEELLTFGILDPFAAKLLIATFTTTVAWLLTTFFTAPEPREVLQKFVEQVQPSIGWASFPLSRKDSFSTSLMSVLVGVFAVYAALFAIGNLVLGSVFLSIVLFAVFGFLVWLLYRWKV